MVNEVRNLEQVTSLCVDRTNEFLNECRCVILLHFIVWQVSPCRINGELLVLTTAVNSLVVLVHNVLTLLAVRLHDELLHLLNSEVYRDNSCDAEECALQDGVCTVAETNLLGDLCSVDCVNGDIVLCEVTLYLVRHEVNKLLSVEDCVQQECTVLAESACHVIHVEICLYVASHEVRSVHQICRADFLVAETEV